MCLLADEDLLEDLDEDDAFLKKERGRVLYDALIGEQ